MGIPLSEASKHVGKTKQTIIKAIRSGRISATKDQNGEWRIEPVELFRLWPAVNQLTGNTPIQVDDSSPHGLPLVDSEIVALLKAEVADLRHRLDQSEAERRETQARIVGLLSDQRPSTPQRGFWSRLFSRQGDSPSGE